MEAWKVLESTRSASLSEIEGVEALVKKLDDGSIAELFESKRVWALFHQMEVVEQSEEARPEELEAYLNVVKALMGKAPGLQRLCGEAALVSRLALTLDSRRVETCTKVLELLAVLAVTSEEGHGAVRGAMEYFRLCKEEAVRFESLVLALQSEATPTPFKRDVMLFVNTLVNSAPDVEQRVEIRAELVRAGVTEAIDSLKKDSLQLAGTKKGMSEDEYELEVQLQVFETVLENDHKNCLATYDGAEVRLDDPDALYEAIKAHCREYDCAPQLLELLQYLVAIPCFDPLGKEHWARILRSAHRAVLGVDDDFVLGFDEIKHVATWKQTLDERAARVADLEKKLAAKTSAATKPVADPQQAKRIAELEARVKELEAAAAAAQGQGGGDPRYAKYFKMLQMHIPRSAVEAKMRAEGVDPAILDRPPPAGEAAGGSGAVGDDPRYAKFFKMLKMHLPREAVEAKMRAEGVDVKILDLDPTKPAPEGPPKLCEDPRYAKYFKMLKMHLPRPAVEAKMRAEGVDVKILDLDPEKPAPAADDGPKLGEDPKYSKFFKMLKMHLPRGAVEVKMRAEGLDPAVLDLDPNKPMPADFATKAAAQGKARIKASPKKDLGPKKHNPKPRVPMRSLFWSKIDERDKTVWKNLSDDNIELSETVIESLEADFAKNTNKGGDAKNAKKEAPEKKKELNLVDGKVSQNVGIVLRKLKMSNAEVRAAIVAVDEEKLDAVKCELLLKSCPTPEDAAAVAEFSGDVSQLGLVEQFFREIAVIPDIQNRLECVVFKHKLESTCETLDARLKTVTAACERVSRSERLARLLEIVLKIGNYLNGGTGRGGVFGFKLDALAKLATVKSIDNSRSLMNWLVQWCEDREPALMEFDRDFPEIEEAARCSLPQWTSDLGQLKAKINLVGQQIQARRKQAPKGDRFVEVMTPFRERAAAEAETLARRFEATEQRFGALVLSFGEDPKTCGVEEFFKNLLGDFVAEFAKARQQNEKRRAMEEKARQREAAAEKRAALKAAGENSENLVNDTFSALKAEDADDILAKLQGPRMKRQATRTRTLADGEPPSTASPSSERMKRFVKRARGVPEGSAAHHKLAEFRNRGHRKPSWDPSGSHNNSPADDRAANSTTATVNNNDRPGPLAKWPPEEPPTPPPPAETPPAPTIAVDQPEPAVSPAISPVLSPVPPPPSNSSGVPDRPRRPTLGQQQKSELEQALIGNPPKAAPAAPAASPPKPPAQPQPPAKPKSGGGELLKKLNQIKGNKKKPAPPK